MKQFFTLLVALMISTLSFAQLSGTITVGSTGTYTTLEAAITALNAGGVGAGGVTFNVAAGHTETLSSATVGIITATGTSANPIVFQKSGAGANPLITSFAIGTATAYDGIIKIVGGDYITFNGIDLQENAANVSATKYTDWGYAILKASATDGSSNVTIKNCNITLSKVSTSSVGIYVASVGATGTTITPTNVSGIHSYLKVDGCSISNVYIGISLNGNSTATYYDNYNEIGTTTANTITNFGGAASTAYGIYGIYQNNIKLANNTINGGEGQTSTHYGIMLSTGTNSNYDIYGNIITLASTTNLSGQACGIYFSIGGTGTNNTGNVYNNIIQNCAYNAATSATFYGFYMTTSSPVYFNFYNNQFKNNTYGNGSSTATGSIYPMYLGGTANSTTGSLWKTYGNQVYGNVRTQSALGSGVFYAIYQTGYGLTTQVYNNTIYDNTMPTTTSTQYLMYVSGTTTTNKVIYGNNIYNHIGSGGNIYGIYNNGGLTADIYKNKIYNIEGVYTSGTYTTYGIYTTGPTTTNIFNNYISNLRNINSTSTNAVSGLYIAGGTNVNAYYNTIYLEASSSSMTTFGTSGIYASTTPIVDLRNNIVLNKSMMNGVPTSPCLNVAYWRSSTTLTSYASVANKNCFFVDPGQDSSMIYYDGTNRKKYIEDFKNLVSPRDAGSFSEEPPFNNIATNNFHLVTGTPTQCEGGGDVIASVSDDYDGNARSASTPDIGADEGAFTMLDLTAPSMSYTVLPNTAAQTARTLSVTITDGTGVPTTGLGLPILYWKVNAAATWTAVTAASQGAGVYAFTFGAGVSVGDSISYYIVSQDTKLPTPNVGASPSVGATGFSSNPPAASMPPTIPNYYKILPAIAGTFHVGVGKDYTTLTAAVADYNVKEITAPVTFLLDDATYAGETFPIVINQNTGASAVNTLTIKPNTATTVTLSGSSASSIIKFNGADFVIIDGSNSGGTDKSLTITNTNTVNATASIWVSSLGNNAGAIRNSIKNCNISTGGNAVATNYGISVGGSTIGSSGADNDYNTIQNNTFTKSYVGIYAAGSSTTNPGLMDSLMVIGNTLGSNTANDYIGFKGMSFTNMTTSLVGQNTVFNIKPASGITTITAIEFAAGVINTTITRNNINNIVTSATGGYGAWGMSFATANAASNNTISNNILYQLNGSGYSSITNTSPCGIYISSGGGYNIWHNTISMTGNNNYATNTITACIYVASGLGNIDIRNNILYNSMGNANTSYINTPYLIYNAGTATNFSNIDYNDYFSVGYTSPFACYQSSAITTIEAWRTATTKDVSSQNIDPGFTSITDLSPSALPINNTAAVIAAVTNDYTGAVRSATPDFGAFEFTVPNDDAGIVAITAPVSPVPTSATPIFVNMKNFGINALATVNINYQVNGGAVTTFAWAGNLASGNTVTAVNIGSYAFSAYNSTLKVWVTLPNGVADGKASNDTSTVSLIVCNPLSGTYTIGATGDFTSFVQAFDRLNSCGVGAPVTFNIAADYVETITLAASPNNFGLKLNATGTATNTITFQKSGIGANPSLGFIGTSNTSDAGIWLNASDFVTFNGIDIIDSGTTSANWIEYGLHLYGSATDGCSYNTFKNGKIDLTRTNINSRGIRVLANSPTSTNGACNYNKFYNNTIQDACQGYYIVGTTTYKNIGNEIGTVDGGTSIVQGIGFITSGASVIGVYATYNDSLKIFNTLIDTLNGNYGTYPTTVGIYEVNSSNAKIYGNTIRKITTGANDPVGINYEGLTSTDNAIYNNTISEISAPAANINSIRLMGTGMTINIYGNEIKNLTNSGAGTTNGIYCSYSTSTVNIYKNNLHTWTNSGANANVIYGIMLGSTGNTYNVYNNIIYDLNAPASTGTAPAVSGIRAENSTCNVYYNSVLLNYTSTSATNTSAAFYVIPASAVVDARNNIFVNKVDVTTSGTRAAAMWFATTALTNYTNLSNNNLFYGGVASTKNLLFYDGTNSDQTLASFKTRMSTRDQQSNTEDVAFASSVSPFDLNIPASTVTRTESGGQPINGITTDYNGSIRSLTSPDMGAYEFTGVPVDELSPIISYTNLTNQVVPATLTATITDPSGVATSGLGLPVLYWKKSTDVAWTSSTATSLGSNQYSFSIGTGLAPADICQYYVVAQDNAGIPNVGCNPAAGATGFTASPPAASTAPTTPNSFTVLGSIAGDYHIGVGKDFATLTLAAAAFNTKQVTAPVTFYLDDATYTGDVFPIIFNQNQGANAANTLTIKPNAATTVTLSGSSASSIIKLNGADYVTIDGSNSGGTDKSLTISNTSTSATTAGIWIASLGNNAGATYNTVKNCNVATGANSTATTYGIAITGSTIGSSGADNDNNTIQNNNVSKAYIGIWAQGSAVTNPGIIDNLQIIGNTIGSAATTDYVSAEGIDVSNITGSSLNLNIVYNIKNTITTGIYGIKIGLGVFNTTITRNNINNVTYTGTGGYGGWAIGLASSSNANIILANNIIYQINGDGFSSITNSSPCGLYITAGTGYNIWNNTISMTGNNSYASGSTISACIYVASGLGNIDLRNNILYNAMGHSGAPTYSNIPYLVYNAGAASNFSNIDYNNYFAEGYTSPIVNYQSAAITTLAAWKTATTKDAASINTNPYFTSTSDLNPQSTFACELNNKGVVIGSVTHDYTGAMRSSTPDIGAFEFNTSIPATPVITSATTICFGAANTSLSATGTNQTWFSDAALTTKVGTGSTYTPSVTAAATYTYYATDSIGTCYSSAAGSGTFTINSLPTATTSLTSATICSGDSVQLSVSLTGTAPWTITVNDGGPSQIVNGITTSPWTEWAKPTSATTYSVTSVSDATTCSNTSIAQTVVTVNTKPIVSFTGLNASYCIDAPAVTLVGTPSGIGGIFSGAGIIGSTFTPSTALVGSHTIKYTYTDGNNCTDSVKQDVTVNDLPIVTLASLPAKCVDAASFALSGGLPTGGTYSGTGVSSGNFSPSTAGVNSHTITYSFTDGNTCANSATTQQVVNALPSVSFSGLNTIYCTADAASTLVGTPTGGSFTGSGISGNIFTPSSAGTGSKEITYSYTDGNTCSNVASHATDVYSTPNVVINTPAAVCSPSTIDLTASAITSGSTSGLTYSYWTDITATAAYLTPATATNGTYYIKGATTNCFKIESVLATVNTLPEVYAGADKSIPYGTSTSLLDATASGFGTLGYAWTPTDSFANAAILNPTTVNISSSQVLSLKVTDGNNCVNYDNMTLSVTGGPLSASPTATPAVICSSDSSVLNVFASGGSSSFTYIWANSTETGATRTVKPTVTTTYTVTVDDGFNQVTKDVVVNVNPLPSAAVTAGTTTFCQGESVLLTATGTGNYQWRKNGTAISGATSGTYTANASGNYKVVVTNPTTSCIDSTATAITVTVNPLPSAAVTAGTTTFCQGGSVLLTATGTGNYQWRKNGIEISGATNAAYTANESGNYKVVVTDATTSCIDSTATAIAVTVNPLPSAAVTAGTTTFCQGGSVLLTASGTGNYQWRKNGIEISGATNAAYTANESGNYKVVVTDATTSCIDSTATAIAVTVNPLPSAAVTAGTTTFCQGGSVLLTATGTGNYQWRKNGIEISGATNAAYTANESGNYKVVVTDATTSCIDSTATAIAVTVNPLPSAAVTAGTTTFCQGGSVLLTASGTGNYQWRKNGIEISGATNAAYTANASGNYKVVVTDATTSCIDSTATAIAVTVNPLPSAAVTAGTTTFCQGGSVLLTATGTGNYQWRKNGIEISGATNAAYTANASGNYKVVVTNPTTSCIDSTATAIAVTVNPLPSAAVTAGTTTFCQGGSVLLTATGTGNYQWRKNGIEISGATNAAYTANASGNYKVVVTNPTTSCIDSTATAIAVTVNPLPVATITPSGSTTFCQGGSVTLNTPLVAGQNYVWKNGNVVINGATSASYLANASGSYKVLVSITATGCSDSTATPKTVIVNPNPTLTISGLSSSYCVSNTTSVALIGTPSGGIFAGTGVTGSTFKPSAAGVGTHTVLYSYTDANNCSSSATTNTVVNALPTLALTTLSAKCIDAAPFALNFASPTGGAYSGTGVSSGNFNPSVAGVGTTYIKYTYTDPITTCTNKDSASILVNALPVISISGSSSPYCLNAIADTLTGSPANGTFTGMGMNGMIFTAANAGVGSHYIIYGATDANSCYNKDSVALVVQALPVVAITNLSANYCTNGWDTTITATPAGGTFSGVGMFGNVFKPSTVAAGPANITYTYTDATTNCTNAITSNTTIYAPPTVSLGSDTTSCGSVMLDAGTGFTGYLWSTGATTQNLLATTSNTYIAGVKDAHNCYNADTINVTIVSLPVVNLGNDTNICNKFTLTLDAGNPLSTYLWSTGATTQTIVADTVGLGAGHAGWKTIWVKVTSSAGCVQYDTITIFFQDCLGLSNAEGSSIAFNVYPNPNKGQFKVEVGQTLTNARISMMDMTGNIITEETVNDNSGMFIKEFNLPNLSKGVYFIRIVNENQVNTKRVIVQ